MTTPAIQPVVTSTSANEFTSLSNHVRCRQCGYDLFGLPRDGRCPECGASVESSIGARLLELGGPTLARLRAGAGWLLAATFAAPTCVVAAGMAPRVGPLPFAFCCVATIVVYARASILLCSTVAVGAALSRLRTYEFVSAVGILILAAIPPLPTTLRPQVSIALWVTGFALLAVSGPRRLSLLGHVLREIAAGAGDHVLAAQLDEGGQFGGIAVAIGCGAAAVMILGAAMSPPATLALTILLGIPGLLMILLAWAQTLDARAGLWKLMRTITR